MEVLSNQYLAGLFDGEGCVHIQRRKNGNNTYNYELHIFIINTNKNIIDKLFSQFSGTVYQTKNNQTNKRWSICWDWILVSKKAGLFLEKNISFFSYKKRAS